METYAVEWTEWAVHKLLFWETDDAKKGRIVRAFHHAGVYAIGTLILVSHTLYPALWLQTLMLVCVFLVWVQHILTHGCVFSKVEQRLMKDDSSFLDPFLDLFEIDANERSKQGIVMMGSTLFLALLSLEWVGKVIPILLAQIPAVTSALHTLPPLSSP